jgi:hypothetical protein
MPETPDGPGAAHSRIDDVIEAIINDPMLRRRIAIDPDAAVAMLDLSATERTLLLNYLHEPK